MVNDKFCRDCKYCTSIGELHICNYFLATGIRRPCPGGEGCTVKDNGKKRRTWSVENNATWERIKQRMDEAREQKRQQRKRTAICVECGEEFIAYDPRHIYCSKRCKNRAGWKKQYAAIVEQRKAKQVIRTTVCPECGKEFQTTNPKKSSAPGNARTEGKTENGGGRKMRKHQNNHLLASFQNQLENRYDKMLSMQSEIELMATIIAANNELKVGAGRAGFFTAEILHMRMMIAKEIVGEDDPELLYTRHNLAKRLKEIYGKDWGKFRELFPMLKEYWD